MKFKRVVPAALLTLIIAVAILTAWDVRLYGTPFQTQNGGVTYGECGVEVWGEPGHFCGDY